jgi:hypothetical protein
MQPAANDFQDALFRQIEKSAGERRHAGIDVIRYGGRGDRLRGLEKPERQRDPRVAKIPSLLGHIKRRRRQRAQQPEAHRVRRVHASQWHTGRQRRDHGAACQF